jgi:threonyl-tRNA synthetase
MGAKEAADDHVALRLRDGSRLEAQSATEVLSHIAALIDARSPSLWDAAPCA